ncbi:MAG: LptA/OstA family protein [Candidatus Brocadiia bacterium]
MDKAFRLSLRVAFGLTLLAGVALVLYSLRPQSTQPDARGTNQPKSGSRAAQNVPAPSPNEMSAAETSPETDEADEQNTTDSVLLDFSQVIRGTGETPSEATLSGPKATFSRESKIWNVMEPLLTADFAAGEDDEGVDIQWEEVRVTADEASLDLGKATVRLKSNARVAGEDFELTTDQITYRGRERTLSAPGYVEFRKHELSGKEGRQQAMAISGEGLDVDMFARKLVLSSDVETHLYGVSREFLASEQETDATEPGEVVITADGRLTYEDLGQIVTFNDNVVATFTGKVLRCDKLTIQLEEPENGDNLAVTDVVATGNVTLTHGDQRLQGDSMEWRNVTQAGVLRGDPALVETPQFSISGTELSFYRLNNLFDTDSPGRLQWKELPSQSEQSPDRVGGEPDAVGPFHMQADTPVTITWQESLRYDVEGNSAVVRGDVVVQQGRNSLTCDQLEINLQEQSNALSRIVAQGDVGLRDALTGETREALCERLVWDAVQKTVEMSAAQGNNVSIRTGAVEVSAPRVVFNNETGALQCPDGGRLMAQQSDEQDADSPPMQVTWQESMEFRRQPEPLATFTGSAVVRRGEESIRGDRLRLEFDEEMAPKRVVAEGNAVIDARSVPASEDAPGPEGTAQGATSLPGLTGTQAERWRMNCEEVEILPSDQMIHSATPGTIEIMEGGEVTGRVEWVERMDFDSKNQYAQFVGAVRADVQDTEMRSRELRLDLNETGQLRNIAARGEVYFNSPERGWEVNADSAQAVFAAENALRQVIARGNVRIDDESRALAANRVTLFLDEDAESQQTVVTRAIAEEQVLVRYQQPEREGRLEGGGDRLEWQEDSDTYALTGDPAYLRRDNMKTQNWKIILERTTGKLTLPPGDRPVITEVGPTER